MVVVVTKCEDSSSENYEFTTVIFYGNQVISFSKSFEFDLMVVKSFLKWRDHHLRTKNIPTKCQGNLSEKFHRNYFLPKE